MNEKATIEYLVKVRDGLQEQLDATNEFLETFKPSEIRDSLPDLSRVVWTQRLGPHGVFEISEEEKNNPGYAELLASVKAHDGKMTVGSYFVWLLQDNKTIGRKPKR